MNTQKVIFAVHDATTYQNLRLIEKKVAERHDTEYLFLNELFGESLPAADEHSNSKHAIDYVRHKWVPELDCRTHPGPLWYQIPQQILYDMISPDIPYYLDQYLSDADPDLLMCAHDRLPFVKHLLKRLYCRDIPTVALQHGIRNIRDEQGGRNRRLVDVVRPNSDPLSWTAERIKRRTLYPYGAFILGNPFVDEIYTVGKFFSEVVHSVRRERPCFGGTKIVETGYPEYGNIELQPYSPNIDSVLFLSTWEYEAGLWDDELLGRVLDILTSVRDTNDVSITVRPHPKDSQTKIERYGSEFEISDQDSLVSDIDRHDMSLTSFSTTILPSAIRGKVCGALHLPWERNRFGPFTDPFVLQIDEEHTSIHYRSTRRTPEDQEQFLKQYCFLPKYHHPGQFESPAEYIAMRLTHLLENPPEHRAIHTINSD